MLSCRERLESVGLETQDVVAIWNKETSASAAVCANVVGAIAQVSEVP